MIAFLEVTWRIVVAVDSTGGSWCCVSEVTLVGWITKWARYHFTLLTEARLLRTRQLGTIWIYTSVDTFFLLGIYNTVSIR
jgi:hypothetical protein